MEFHPCVIETDRRVLRWRRFSEVLAMRVCLEAEKVQARRIVDLGTGSGIVAINVAKALPGVEVWATEIRQEALELARTNAARNGVTLRFALGSWFDALDPSLAGTIDIAIATPPYLSDDEYATVDERQRADTPRLAMVGGPTGLEPARSVSTGGLRWLRPGGMLFVEAPPEKLAATAQTIASYGYDPVVENHWLCVAEARHAV